MVPICLHEFRGKSKNIRINIADLAFFYQNRIKLKMQFFIGLAGKIMEEPLKTKKK